jgi:FADH2 O2-dependent halogenase
MRSMTSRFDVAIVGSGFAGSLTALILRRLGLSVVLIERGAHPRFAIGESSSPLANLLLEELCDRYGLDRIRPLCAWGSWRRAYPEVACGLKRGFTFYAHRFGERFGRDAGRADQLLVAASPCDEVADTHWYRADFDAFLAAEAERAGAVHLDRARIERIDLAAGAEIAFERGRRRGTVRATLVVDASGPAGALARSLGVGAGTFPGYPETEALYTHFEGVRRLDDMDAFASPDAPYPIDDAAVHHVFASPLDDARRGGGWIWVLRFSNGITSAGVAAEKALARELRLEEGAPAWERLLDRLPSVRDQFAGARPVLPFVDRRPPLVPRRPRLRFAVAAPPLGRRVRGSAALDRLPADAARHLAARAHRRGVVGGPRPREPDGGAGPGDARRGGCGGAADLGSLRLVRRLRRLCSADASVLRGRELDGELPASRQIRARDEFPPPRRARLRSAAAAAVRGRGRPGPGVRRAAADAVRQAIEPFDVIGLNDETRRNWYPADARDLLAARHKLGASGEEIAAMLERTGLSVSGRPSGSRSVGIDILATANMSRLPCPASQVFRVSFRYAARWRTASALRPSRSASDAAL